jgi:ferrous iron transport protein A
MSRDFPPANEEGNAGGGGPSVTLDALPRGVAGRVVRVEGVGPVARRLMEMGIVPGARVEVVREAPLGDPVEVRVMSYHLALRRNEARTITVISDE